MASAGDAGETSDTRDGPAAAPGAPAGAGSPAPGGTGSPGRGAPAGGAPRRAAAAGFLRSLAADPVYGPLHGLLLILSLVTGVVDAVSILALGRVFVANMTGNVVFAAFAIVGAPGFSLSASLFALAGFLAGASAGGVLIARAGADRATLLRAGTAAELLLAAVVLVIAAVSGDAGTGAGTLAIAGRVFGPAVTDVAAALLAVTLGIQSAVARRLAVPDLSTTVLTMTLTGLGSEIRTVVRGIEAPGPGRRAARAALGRRLAAIAAIFAGGAAGALLVLHVSPLSGLCLVTALITVAAAGAALAARRPGPWRAFPSPKR